MITYAAAIQEALISEFERNHDYIYLGEDVGKIGGTVIKNGLYKKFGGKRCVDMPIAENLIVGAAMGISLAGMRGVAELMVADFVSLAMDPIVNEAAKYRFNSGGQKNVPLTVITVSGAFDRTGHAHSQCTEAWISNVPGIKIVIPSSPADAKGLLISALRDNDPVVVFLSKACMRIKGEVPEEDIQIPLGKARIARTGTDVTIVAWHHTLIDALNVADKLYKEQGIDVEVIDPRTLVPFDYQAVVLSTKKTGRLIVASEASKQYSCTSEIISYIAEYAYDALKCPPVRLGSLNTPIPYFELEDQWRLSSEEIEKSIVELIQR